MSLVECLSYNMSDSNSDQNNSLVSIFGAHPCHAGIHVSSLQERFNPRALFICSLVLCFCMHLCAPVHMRAPAGNTLTVAESTAFLVGWRNQGNSHPQRPFLVGW